MARFERIASISESTSTTTEDETQGIETSKYVPSIENDGSVVKEKVRLEKRSTTTKTPKRRRATLIRFARVRDRENFARAQLLLCNISNRSFRYKIKGEPNAIISALPSSKGYLSARGSARCVLTWHKPEGFDTKHTQTKLILYTYFVDSQSGHSDRRSATRLVASVSKNEWCDATGPPVQQLMLDAENALSSERWSTHGERSAVRQVPIKNRLLKDARSKTSYDSVIDEMLDWLCSQSHDTIIMIIFCGVIIYSMGVADSSKYERFYHHS